MESGCEGDEVAVEGVADVFDVFSSGFGPAVVVDGDEEWVHVEFLFEGEDLDVAVFAAADCDGAVVVGAVAAAVFVAEFLEFTPALAPVYVFLFFVVGAGVADAVFVEF